MTFVVKGYIVIALIEPRGKTLTYVFTNQYMVVICYESDGVVRVETLYRLLAVFFFSKLLAYTTQAPVPLATPFLSFIARLLNTQLKLNY